MAIVTVALAASAVPAARVAACDCMMMSPDEAVAAAEVAFTGTVAGERPIAENREPRDGTGGVGNVLYAFEVDGVAKGDVGATVEVLSGGDGASCGVSFGVGDRWLIFASRETDVLATHLCSGNLALAPGEAAPIPVSPPPAGEPQEVGRGLPVAVLVPAFALAALAAASAYLFWRAERPS